MSGASQPTVVVVPSATNTNENSERPPSNERQERELDQAQRFGELLESYRQLQAEIAQLKMQIEAGQASASELAALRQELAELRQAQNRVAEEIREETEESGTVLVTPEPAPAEPEAEPIEKKPGILELILSI